MAPVSQELKPPAIPARLTPCFGVSQLVTTFHTFIPNLPQVGVEVPVEIIRAHGVLPIQGSASQGVEVELGVCATLTIFYTTSAHLCTSP